MTIPYFLTLNLHNEKFLPTIQYVTDKELIALLKELSQNLSEGDLESMMAVQEYANEALDSLTGTDTKFPAEKKLRENLENIADLKNLKKVKAQISELADVLSEAHDRQRPFSDKSDSDDDIPDKAPSFQFPYPNEYFDAIIQDNEILQKYIEEANDHLNKSQFVLIDLEHDPQNDENINTVFRAFHTLKSSSAFLGIKNIEEIAHAAEGLLSLMRDKQIKVTTELIDIIFYGIVFIKNLIDILRIHNKEIDAAVNNFREINIYNYTYLLDTVREQYKTKRIGEILVEMGSIDQEMVDSIITDQKKSNKRFGEIAVEKANVPQDVIDTANELQRKRKLQNSYVKVSADRLNELVDLVGELVVNQSMIRQITEIEDSGFENNLTQLELITSSIKNNVLSMGMIPIGDTFNHLRVVIRNASKETGKIVDVRVEGGETELDRNIIETIYDPLVHIVRNSVDHGLEDSEERKASGKSEVGFITLLARHRGNGIEIQVADDGRGINTDKLIDKALSKGIIDEKDAERLKTNPKDAYNLLFLPGFSTKTEVTELSGRGVGLDVVRKNIDQIRGKVDIQSEPGKGTTFTIRLPLTLAIIDGFVTSVNEERFIFPFHAIDEIVVPERAQLQEMSDGEYFLLNRGQHIPLIFIERILHSREIKKTENVIIIIVSLENHQYGIAVHEVLGKQEVVIKSLNSILRRFDLFSGGTIFGDGSIGFVVDIEAMINHAQRLETGE